MSDVLPDILQAGLTLVFCGTAASKKSAQAGAYYANPTNAFWKTLHEVGLTPHRFQPVEFRQLMDYGIGLTDIAKQASGNDRDLQATDFDETGLQSKIERYEPQILAFTSKRGFMAWSSQKAVAYGWQVQKIGITRLFVLPSPSGAARGYWDISYWQILADTYKQLRAGHD